MAEVQFVCPGNCGGKVNQEEFDQGKTTCAADDCEHHGQSLDKMYFCPSCDVHFKPGEEHDCG